MLEMKKVEFNNSLLEVKLKYMMSEMEEINEESYESDLGGSYIGK